MILLNTSFHLMADHEAEFMAWVNNTYLPAVADSGLFGQPLFLEITTQVDPRLKAFAVQLPAESLDKARQWHDTHAAKLKGELTARWGEEIVYFTTYMKSLNR